ncbi:hypothetical protein ACFQ60_25175 [Streptomyces zhihengii]|uniref:Uncharacterized protein n=1 Tax=Streptomyces zhihengii TaxID=1818004 RepID=A0ABS2USX7_9ACTN|nr:hypothetical protein [Streptomyces zhihengii]MBM9620569.1 hypothetical protein [Streptomyces zhihengii]
MNSRDQGERPIVVTGIRPGLQVSTDERRPVADWLCRCGHHERAVGKWAVVELTGRVNVQHCPHAADAAPSTTARGAEVAARQGVRTVTDLPLPTIPATTADRRTAA